MEIWKILVFGALGGAIPDILRLIRERDSDAPAYMKHWWYWLGFALMVIIGALVAWLFGSSKIVDAIAYGIAAPSLLQGLAADRTKEPKLGGGTDIFNGLRFWWSR
jgi:hypothetical protein